MQSRWLLVVSCLLAAAQAGPFFEEGKEFKYKTLIRQGSGTMDHAPSMAGFGLAVDVRVQQRGRDVFVEMANPTVTEYVGAMGPWNSPAIDPSELKSTPIPGGPSNMQYSIGHDENGLITTLSLPSDVDPFYKNLMKAFASQFSLNRQAVKDKSFTSVEKSLMGECDVEYTVTPSAIYKSVDHNHGCKNMPKRVVNNWRGYDCDFSEDHVEGLHSQHSSTMNIEKTGNMQWKVTSVLTHGHIISQMFGTEGVSHLSIANITSILVSEGPSSGDISGGNENIDSLTYEFADEAYEWNKARDLKAAEPTFSSGFMGEGEDTAKKIVAIEKMADAIIETQKFTGNDPDAIEKAHKNGIIPFVHYLGMLDYAGLERLGKKMMGDKSEDGIIRANLFTEAIGSVGTNAAAMLVKDFIVGKKFENQRDAARALTAVPFHIRRPNLLLLEEFKEIMEMDHGDQKMVKMAAPLTFAHMVRMTCERAGAGLKMAQVKQCFKTEGVKYINYFYDKFQAATDRDDKLAALAAIKNIRFGGIPEKLADVISGKTGDDAEVRSYAMYATFIEAVVRKKAFDMYIPMYADKSLPSEIRIAAASLLMWSKPNGIQLTRIINVLKDEQDYELTNYVFALLEKAANSIDPCDEKLSQFAAYYLKYVKQFTQYEIDWSFGVSKTAIRQFFKEKYGYAGSYEFFTVGTEDSLTPLSVGMAISSTLHNNYKGTMITINVRIEGLAKGLVRKFKSMDAATWQTADLQKIFNGMNIRAKPDQPIRATITILLKGVVVIQRAYDEGSIKDGGRLKNYFQKFQDLGDEYSINHLRMIVVGENMYEQPNIVGFPVFMAGTFTTSGNIQATVKRGQHRGLMFRNVDYNIKLFSQGRKTLGIFNPKAKKIYGIYGDRIYKANFPRKLVIGVNPLRKELKLSISRPEQSSPMQLLMHAYTKVFAFPDTSVKKHCPSCDSKHVVSNGAASERTFLDKDNTRLGVKLMGKYFDCEMDINRRNTVGRAIGAFMPYNKNPKTPWTQLIMGIRQIRAFFIFYPRAEKCGVMFQYSQSTQEPVSEIEISINVNSESNGERLFFRGRKTIVKAMIKGKADKMRAIRLQLSMESTPNNVANKMKLQIMRAGIEAMNIKPYIACIAYQSKYPDMPDNPISLHTGKTLEMNGKLMIQHGRSTSCEDAEGEIRAKFTYSTTKQAREDLKNKWYFKQCMEEKARPEWSKRPGDNLPVTKACIMTAKDITSARRYVYNFEFPKVTERTKRMMSRIRSAVEVGLLPYWGIDPEEMNADGEVGPFLNIDATLHSDDKLADVTIETRQGTKTLNDYALKLPWGRRLRNLVFGTRLGAMMKAGFISPCVATESTVHTMDNVTYAYEADSCWTLMSGHCAETPSYAVFAKKSSGKFPLAMKAYIGGHVVEMDANSDTVTINGSPASLSSEDYVHSVNDVEIFKAVKWGSTYHIYSFLKVWIVYGGDFVEVIAAPSVKGVHCGMCGTNNRNKFDEWTGKDGVTKLDSASAMVNEWKNC